MTLGLAAIAALVGALIGAVGVGGILLIPALNLLTPLSIQASMATALFTFVFTGLIGTWLFQRRGSIDWAVTTPLCVGGVLFGAIGAWVNTRLDATLLTLILALLIALAGLYTLSSGRGQTVELCRRLTPRRRALLFAIGAATGFGSGLTGVGGPAMSVPLMVLFGFPALTSIGASQVIQILAAASGSAANLPLGLIDLRLAALLTVFEVGGVWVGVHVAHAIDARLLRRAVGVLCVFSATKVRPGCMAASVAGLAATMSLTRMEGSIVMSCAMRCSGGFCWSVVAERVRRDHARVPGGLPDKVGLHARDAFDE